MKLKFLFFLTCMFHFSTAFTEQKTKLVFAQILFRHGDRSPTKLYRNDPNPESVWSRDLGQLTILGKKQHYSLGKYLRSMYQNFITSNPLEVNVTSTEEDRCLESAETNMAAFYAPKGVWLFEETLKWQPIPIRYLRKENDKYLRTGSYCPRADAEKYRVLNSPENKKALAEYKEVFGNLSFYSGNQINTWLDALYLYDALYTERKYNLTSPSWAIPYWDQLKQTVNNVFYWHYNSPLLHRLRGAPFIGKIIENMQQKIKGETPDLKFQIYFAHDSTISVVLGALKLFNMIRPPYCAALFFELHENMDGEKVIRLLYQNSSDVEVKIQTPHVLTLEGCKEFCPLDYFINYTQHLIPEDWDMECQLDESLVEKLNSKLLLGCFCILAAIFVSGFIYVLWRVLLHKRSMLISY